VSQAHLPPTRPAPNIANLRGSDLDALHGCYNQLAMLISQLQQSRERTPINRGLVEVLLSSIRALHGQTHVMVHQMISRAGMDTPGLAEKAEAEALRAHGIEDHSVGHDRHFRDYDSGL